VKSHTLPVNTMTDQTTQTDAVRDVLAERQRQISAEGWTPEHDDEHRGGGMAFAAAAYAVHADAGPALTGSLWRWTGWALKWPKPKDRRANLIRAGALILAEIERLDRAKARETASRHAAAAPWIA
jgi:hypothetical protein